MYLQGVSFTRRLGSFLLDDLHPLFPLAVPFCRANSEPPLRCFATSMESDLALLRNVRSNQRPNFTLRAAYSRYGL